MTETERERLGLEYAKRLAAYYRELAYEMVDAAAGLEGAKNLNSNFPMVSRSRLLSAVESATILKFIIDPA